MSSRTKIVVLHMKELIYTAVFAVLFLILIVLLLFMFGSGHSDEDDTQAHYQPGVYTSSLRLDDTDLEVEVTVDATHINAVRISNLDETVTTMYPLIQPAVEEIASQVCETQSTDQIDYSGDAPYTVQLIVDAVDEALKKAAAE